MVRIYYDRSSPQVTFAVGDISAALWKQKHTVQKLDLAALVNAGPGKKIILGLATDPTVAAALAAQGGRPAVGLGTQAYAVRTTKRSDLCYWVLGGDAVGVMYGGLQLAESISYAGLGYTFDIDESPYMLNRGMKLNLPLDRRIPTYVGGWSSNSAKQAIPHVWDFKFWRKLIDQQARNRYNVLTVWVHHPFPALVKLPDYPTVSLPRIEGFDGFVKELNHDQRVAFWRQVMRYAHDRGMKFYFFNWNIYVDYASTQVPALTTSPTNPTTIDYMYKSMRALLQTYPELDGFGITSGDGMDGTSDENTTWTWNTMGKAVGDYMLENPSRQFNLIHRGVKSSPDSWTSIYAPLKDVPNLTSNYSVKYAMAHMYSTTTPRWTGELDAIASRGLKTWLTFRNDDYFYLNWGDPTFVRDFMAGIPQRQAVVGMYIGIDGYNPSRTYFSKDQERNGQLEVERRWYMEMLWGRLSYNPATPDDVFRILLANRYPKLPSGELFEAWALASRSLPKVTELIMGNWNLDFHWYPEGCWSDPGRETGFRTIDGFANDTTIAQGSNLCSIANSAINACNGKKSSYAVANEMQADAEEALSLINAMKSDGDEDLEIVINNIKQLGYLSMYYAHKVRGATYKKSNNWASARTEMGHAYCWWMAYSRSMEKSYLPDSFRNLSISPDWRYADAAVLKEYTDLGGVGIPECVNIFRLTTAATNGSLTLDPSGNVYFPGAVVTLTPRPNFGYVFGSWSGALTGSVSPATITMNGNKSVSANFVLSTSAESLPWIETFTVDNGIKDDGAPSSWRATRSSGLFQVSGNRLMLNQGSAEGSFETGEIAIEGNNAKVSLDVSCDGGVDSGDYVRLFRIVDGGPAVQIDSTIVGKFTGTRTLVGTNITGRRLKLRVLTKVTASDEFYYFDNLRVEPSQR